MTIPIDPKRLEGESFENYKKRQKLVNKAIKIYQKGRYVWKSNKGEIVLKEDIIKLEKQKSEFIPGEN